MIHLTTDYLEQNYKFTDHDPAFISSVFDHTNCVISGLVSVNDTMWTPFESTDNQQWYVFKVKQQDDDRHPYVVVLFGYDDGYCYKNLKSLDEFYQWIKIFEFRDFTHDDVETYIDDVF